MVDPVRYLPLFAWCLITHAGADMTDPTRPPPGFNQPATGQTTPMSTEEEAPLQVNSVFLMGTKPYAMVDGMIVHVGDKLGSGRVSRIDETGVWMKMKTGSRLLPLVSGIEKKTVGRNTASGAAPRSAPSPVGARMENR